MFKFYQVFSGVYVKISFYSLGNFVFEWVHEKFKFYQVFSGVPVKFKFYQVFNGVHVMFKFYQDFSGVQ